MSKRIGRRGIAALLAAVMVFTAVPVSVSAAETVDAAGEVLEEMPDEGGTEKSEEALEEKDWEEDGSTSSTEEQASKSEESSESKTEQTESQTAEEAFDKDETDAAKSSEELTEPEMVAESTADEGDIENETEEIETEPEIEEETTVGEFTVTASMYQSEFDKKLSEIRAIFPHGSKWDERYNRGWQCFGYAHWAANYVAGSSAGDSFGWTQVNNMNSVKAGDIIQYGDTTGNGHTIFVTAVSGNTITYTDANSDWNNTVRWGQTISKNEKYYKYNFSYVKSSPCSVVPDPPPIPIGTDLPNGGSRAILDGDYHIITGVDNNLCLTISGPTKNDGENALLWHCTEVSNQIFTVTWLGPDKGYKIIHKWSGKSLDVCGASRERGANVQQWSYVADVLQQQWVISEVDDGAYYTIQSRCGGFYMDVKNATAADGANVHMWEADGDNAQKWRFIPAGTQTIADGDYQIITAADNNKCLSIDDTNVQVNSRIGQSNAVFTVTYLGNGFYKIIHKQTNSSLDVAWAKAENGTNVQIVRYDGNPAQQWTIRKAASGTYYVQSRCSGHCLDVAVATLVGTVPEGTNVHMVSGHGKSNQQWKFVPYVQPKMEAPTASIPSGTEVEKGTKLVLSCYGADHIYYTTDGTQPTRSSAEYPLQAGIIINTDMTVRTFAVKEGYQDSDIAVFTYTVKQKTPEESEEPTEEESSSNEESSSGEESTTPEDEDLQDGVKWYYNEQNVIYKDLSQYGQIATSIKPRTYDGTPYKPAVKVTATENGKTVTLTEGTDYRVLYYNNIHAGTASVIVKGNGVYKGIISRKFEIKKKSCQKLKVVTNGMLTGDSPAPKIFVYDGNILLKENKDYVIDGITPNLTSTKGSKQIYVMAAPDSDYEGIKAAKITVYDADKGRIKGIIDKSENIKLSQSTYQYTGKACKPTAIVTVDGNTLTAGKDYTIKYQNNKDTGTAFATITGKGSYVGSVVKEFTIKPSSGEFTLRKPVAAVTYNGKLQKPKITVTAGGKTLKLNKDYTISYTNNLHATDRAKITVRGKGNYADIPAKAFYFTINPCHIKKVSVKGGQGSLLVTYAKHTLVEGVDYDVIYGSTAGKGKIPVTIKAKEGSSFTGEVTKKIKQ